MNYLVPVLALQLTTVLVATGLIAFRRRMQPGTVLSQFGQQLLYGYMMAVGIHCLSMSGMPGTTMPSGVMAGLLYAGVLPCAVGWMTCLLVEMRDPAPQITSTRAGGIVPASDAVNHRDRMTSSPNQKHPRTPKP